MSFNCAPKNKCIWPVGNNLSSSDYNFQIPFFFPTKIRKNNINPQNQLNLLNTLIPNVFRKCFIENNRKFVTTCDASGTVSSLNNFVSNNNCPNCYLDERLKENNIYTRFITGLKFNAFVSPKITTHTDFIYQNFI